METTQRDTRTIGVDTKNLIAQSLLQQSYSGHLRHGALIKAAQQFGVCKKTVHRIWAKAKEQMERGVPVNVRDRVRGYNHKDKMQLDDNKVRQLSMLERSTIRKMARKLEISKSTLGRMKKEGLIRPHTSAVKPILTDLNKLARLRWSLSQIQPIRIDGKLKYNTMHNVVHIDEKWFYMTKSSDRYYLLPDEDEPYRSCIFPFTTMEPAKRNSKNRAKGTMETKPIQSVNKAITRDCIIQKIIPAIKSKWPPNVCKEILIQQDNAKPHISPTDSEFQAIANKDGFKFQIICQPPNVLDLGFFTAIQSLQDDKIAKGVDDLVNNVYSSFEELSPHTLNNVFLSLQGCLLEIMKVHGGNGYKLPHMKKARLSRLDSLPITLEVEEELVKEALEYLQLPENNIGEAYDISRISEALGF
ncbi:uncharacterized protein LOC125189809 [Salvia hispanica]|uniref:uncharacterized protein LOC125189809 n=1 Tax=Salvia hispanica TaxID=49212 RepID=UPI0020093967|nr:uncharacterized protein LOC125189809 [Salvia hispanica]